MQSTTYPTCGLPVFQFQEDQIASNGVSQASLIYRVEGATLLRWAASFPLPGIADHVQPRMARIGPVEVTGYFRDGDQIGIIAIARRPHWWLTNENDRDRMASDSALYRDGTMRSKLCLLGNEIKPPIKKAYARKQSHSSRPRAEHVAL